MSEILLFSADMGGTEILEPIQAAISLKTGERVKKIFLLTDGEVSNKD